MVTIAIAIDGRLIVFFLFVERYITTTCCASEVVSGYRGHQCVVFSRSVAIFDDRIRRL